MFDEFGSHEGVGEVEQQAATLRHMILSSVRLGTSGAVLVHLSIRLSRTNISANQLTPYGNK